MNNRVQLWGVATKPLRSPRLTPAIYLQRAFFPATIQIMKSILLLIIGILPCTAQAQDNVNQGANPSTSSGTAAATENIIGYQIDQQDGNSCVWQKIVQAADGQGNITYSTNTAYTELASGLNHQINGQWVPSSEAIAILPDGTGAATNGQHQAYFPGDIYAGQITVVTRSGRQLVSRPLGLTYFDGTNTVLIAALTNSVGFVVGENQVVYPNAFMEINADLQYTYTKAGFEQDVILHEQPPTPESFGLNADTARLQIMTEFFSSLMPTVQSNQLPSQAGVALTDQALNFGTMQMTPGRAFRMGQNADPVNALVAKHWVTVQGRHFLIEEVPVDAIVAGLASLPLSTMKIDPSKVQLATLEHLTLPQLPAVDRPLQKSARLVRGNNPTDGFVLDYQAINTSLTNYVFQGDTTYYISGTVNLFGASVFEGGAVFKYATNASLNLGYATNINCQSSAYRPIIFTAKDDNSVGGIISGSTGTPSGYYANPVLSYGWLGSGGSFNLSYFRIAWANTGIKVVSTPDNLFHGQFVNCLNGISRQYGEDYVRNVLFANVQTNFVLNYAGADVQNSTFSGSSCLVACSTAGGMNLTNCILANMTCLTNSGFFPSIAGDHNGFYNSPAFGTGQVTNTFYPFQAAGAGNFYLTNGCAFANAGTLKINPTLLANLQQKTTWPPVVYSNVTIMVNTTLSPQAQRDTESPGPDLGYHYDPIDYLVDNFSITNAMLTVTNGVAIASYNETGIQLQDNSAIVSIGSPLYPNWFVRYSSAQEESVLLGGNSGPEITINASPSIWHTGPNGQYSFSKFATPASSGDDIADNATTYYNNLLFQNCEFYSGPNYFGTATNTTVNILNCLFWRSSITAIAESTNSYLNFSNNTFYGTGISFMNPSAVNNWSAYNNDFDSCVILEYDSYPAPPMGQIPNGFNAYLNCRASGNRARLYPTNAFDIVMTNSLAYQTGPLGSFYQPSGSPLLNKGSTTADQVGLYHFTVTTNEVVDGTNLVSIGYHYVATDAYGNPLDSNGDGVPDYIEDANGNGLVDNGEANWALAIISQPVSQTVVEGNNATFSVLAAGIGPVQYQWYYNSTALANATNASLALTNIQPGNAGSYCVVVANNSGSMTSSVAVLTVLVPPVIIIQPSGQTALWGGNVTMSVTAGGTPPLSYQWQFNGTNILGATNSSLIITDVQSTDAGNYFVVVANLAGSMLSSNALLMLSPPGLLGSWQFDTTNWFGDQGQIPVQATNIELIPSWSSNAMELDTSDGYLVYNLVENNGHTNLSLQNGTIRFWFCPYWSSVSQGGNGPNDYPTLFEVDDPDTGGYFEAYIYPDGNTLEFDSIVNANVSADLNTPISWKSNQWHQVAITYTPTSFVMYIDGVAVSTSGGSIYMPDATTFYIGNDIYVDPAYGLFDEMDTFDYPLSAQQIAADYQTALNQDSDGNGLPDLWEWNNFGYIGVDPNSDPAGNGHTVLYDYQNGLDPNDYYAGQPPALEVVSGNNELGQPDLFLPQPVTILVTDTNAAVLSNAPVTFTVTLGGAELAATTNDLTVTNLTLRTDPNGLVSVWVYFPMGANLLTNTISVQGGNYPVSTNVNVYLDTYGTGIPDYWALAYFGTNYVDSNSDPVGNGQTLLFDYQNGLNPNDYYNGHPPELEIVSGNNQNGSVGSFLPAPLIVQVTDVNSNVLTNAPITLTTGNAQLALLTNGVLESSLSLRTDSNGLVSVWAYIPASAALQNGVVFVNASTPDGSSTNFVEFIGRRVPMLAVGGERIMALSTNGDLVSWGGNQYGEFGDYTHIGSTNAVHVVGLTNIVSIASGLNRSLALDANGSLWAWGWNTDDGGYENSTGLPIQVPEMTGVTAIAAHGNNNGDDGLYEFSSAVKFDGSVWTWFGFGSVPVQIAGISNAVTVAIGAYHTLCLKVDGTVLAWGGNYFGELGNGTTTDSDTPVQVTGLSNIVSICAGDNHSLALDSNGSVWAWGFDQYGQLGDGQTGAYAYSDVPVMLTGLSNVVAIAAGTSHSLAIDSSGNLWAWGDNEFNQLAELGISNTNLPTEVAGLTNIISIGAGSDASVAMDGNGNLWQWGEEDDDRVYETDPVFELSDTDGYPTIGPAYVDFYNGQLPALVILNGNNQLTEAGAEFAQPLVIQVKNSSGVALSNAPVSVEVITGDMELRTISGGNNSKGLRLTTDINGEVSLIGYADRFFINSNCQVRVLAASRQQITEVDFTETLLPGPTITITSLISEGTYLVNSKQTLNIKVNAQPGYGSYIQKVDYYYSVHTIPGSLSIGSSTISPFPITWTNAGWTNGFVGTYDITAIATDSLGVTATTTISDVTIALDADGNGLPDYWEIEYFGQIGLTPDSSPDGNGQTLLYDYRNGIDPTDYYNGVLPTLEILSGNNQGGSYDSFLPLPVTVQVTGMNSSILTGAPVTFTVANGTALLAATSSDTPTNSLALRTDENGQASVWVYFPPASTNPPDSAIWVSATSGINSVSVMVNEHAPIGHWTFNDTNTWIGEGGQLPLLATNVNGIPSWSSNAVQVDSLNPASLAYNVVETNGNTNITCQTGSVLFWFKPDWNSANAGDGGPGTYGRLIEIGSYNPAFTNGWWGLYLSPDGTQLSFGTSANGGGGMTNLSANISWTSNEWHRIELTYSPTDSVLYLDGQWATNGAGVVYFPSTDELANGFRIGSDQNGNNQAEGAFEELETFDCPLNLTSANAPLPLSSPVVTLVVTNGLCSVTLEQDLVGEIVSSVSGLIYPNFISFLVANDYADSVFASEPGYQDRQGQGINITKLPTPIITPNGGFFTASSNVVISLGAENLTNLVSGLYQTELGRLGSSDEIQTVVAYAQGLRNFGYTDEDIRASLIYGSYFRGSAEYVTKFGGPIDVYLPNTNYTIEYSTNAGVSWSDYNGPIPFASSMTLSARVQKSGTSDNRTHYVYLASNVAEAEFDYIDASWLEQYFGTNYLSNPDAGPDADPNGDGLSNLQDYQLGINPTNVCTYADGVPALRLGYWRFDTIQWLGEEGQVPLDFTNLASIPDWSHYALGIDTNLPAYLAYRVVETNGSANINLCNGSIRFWFKPDWNSATTNNGIGPGTEARLIEIGSQGSADGWWALVLSPDGAMLSFDTWTNGAGMTNLTVAVKWTSNDWHQVVLTYSATNSTLYLDGQAVVTNGLGVSDYPDAAIRANGFFIGSDNAGNNQAQGQFDELETFNYSLSADLVSTNYNTVDLGGGGPIDYIGYLEGLNPSVHGAAVPDTNGIVNLQIYTPLH